MFKWNRKVAVAALSLISNAILITLKIVAGILSGSVSIISEAIHSSMDFIASAIAFFSVNMSSKPPDKEHPYGHGKIENVSGVIEGLLILVAAFLIIREAVTKIFHPSVIEQAYVAAGVMLFSAIANIIVSHIIYKVAKEEDSIALEADALHLKADVYTSLGVCAGILLIKITGLTILDPIVALLVACLILKESWVLCNKAFRPLLDTCLSDAEEKKISEVMENYKEKIIDYHQLRTRKSGNIKYIEFHMTVRSELTVKESHELTEMIENDIEAALKNTNMTIHIEPA